GPRDRRRPLRGLRPAARRTARRPRPAAPDLRADRRRRQLRSGAPPPHAGADRACRGAGARPVPASADRPGPGPDPRRAQRLKRGADGRLTAVVQDATAQRVLMGGWMDDEARHRTPTTGRATYWSRSRGEYWRKGDTSGHVQWV